jgi:hypothetical protein
MRLNTILLTAAISIASTNGIAPKVLHGQPGS